MYQKKLLNLILSLALVGLTGASIVSRSSVHKIGLGLISLFAIATSSSIRSRIEEKEKSKFESQLKSLRAQVNEKDLEISVKEKEITKLKQDHEGQLVDTQQLHRQEIANLAAENHSAFETKIQLINRKHAIEIEKLTATHEQEIKATDTYIDSLRKEKSQLQGTIQTLQKEHESLRDDYAQRVTALNSERSNLDNAKQQFEFDQKEWLLKRREIEHSANSQIFLSSKQESEALALEWKKLNQAIDEYNKKASNSQYAVNKLKEENEILRQKLGLTQKALSTNNGRYNLTSLEGMVANSIEKFFARQQLPVRYVHGEEHRTKDNLILKFTAKEENKPKIIKLAEPLSQDVFAGKSVNIYRKDGYLMFNIPIEERVELATISNPETQDHSHLEKLVTNSNHYLVMGATGDGKSAATSNLLELAGKLLVHPTVVFLNPKPTGVDFWFRGKKLEADFLNLETPPGCHTPDCFEGLQYIDEVLTERMATAQKVEEKNKNRNEADKLPFPNFNPILVVVDECQALRSENDDYKKLFTKIIKKLARLGREFKMIAILLGQDNTCGEWGFSSRAMFMNFTRLYFASLLNVSSVHTQEIKFLPNADEVKNSIEEFKSKRSSNKLDPHNFYGLFIQQGNAPGYIAYLPKPNHFHQETDSINCPNCGSDEVVKNGLKDGKQSYKCKSCETQFRDDAVVSPQLSEALVG